MKIEVYFDVVCPWCYIGERRLQGALDEIGREDVDVVFRPFQLDATAPTESAPLHTYLTRRFGAAARSVQARTGAVAEQEGIHIDWDRALIANTLTAHRLVRLARTEYDADVQRGVVEALFDAHFTRGRDVGDQKELVDIGSAAGMDRRRVESYLRSDEGVAEVRAEIAAAHGLGIHSVPTFIIDDRYAIEGAQPADMLARALEQVRAESAGAAPGSER